MPIADKIAALFAALTREEVDTMRPATREYFAQLCQHWADFAKIHPEPEPRPAAGVLVELRDGRQT